MCPYENLKDELRAAPKRWLITGVAGFIGSHLLETLIKLDQRVIGLDNFSSGKKKNLEEVRELVEAAQWARFQFAEADIVDLDACRRWCQGADFVLHQAALGSVPRSMTTMRSCQKWRIESESRSRHTLPRKSWMRSTRRYSGAHTDFRPSVCATLMSLVPDRTRTAPMRR